MASYQFDTTPFLCLLSVRPLVTEADVCRAYGFTSVTKGWPSKVSHIASNARKCLREQYGIELPRADMKRSMPKHGPRTRRAGASKWKRPQGGWSLKETERAALREALDLELQQRRAA